MSEPRKYKCPYCVRVSLSPGGVSFHVRMDHPDKVREFNEDHYPDMKEAFKK